MGKQKKKNLVERNTITRLLSSLFGDCDAQTCRLRRLLSLATHHLGAIAGTLLEKLSQRRKPRNNSEKNKALPRSKKKKKFHPQLWLGHSNGLHTHPLPPWSSR